MHRGPAVGQRALLPKPAGAESRFVFDRRARRLAWHRRTLLRRVSGELSLDDIEALAVESDQGGDERGRSKRLALITRTGRIPLTRAYTTITGGHERAARAIRELLGGEGTVPLYR